MQTRASLTSILAAFIVAAISIVGAAGFAYGQEITITYPISELGGCTSKAECRAYCDGLSHIDACVSFAEAHGLMSAKEAVRARQLGKIGKDGPGGCDSKSECESYCKKAAHMRECIRFAKDTGALGDDEIEHAEKFVAYVERGGETPGGCFGEECKTYCEDPSHMEECMDFAMKAGLMSEKEAAMFKKTGGKGPGGCRGRECERFCEDEANREACISFAMEHDLMSEEDKARMEEGKERAKEALEKAPPEVLACIEAALGAEKFARMRAGEGLFGPRLGEVLPRCFKEVMKKGDERGPFGRGSDARSCMRKVFGDDFEQKMMSGELDPGARDDEIRECMRAERGGGSLNDEGKWERPGLSDAENEGRKEFRGPGGCSSRQECESYCSEHADECGGGMQRGDVRVKYQEKFDMRPGEIPSGYRDDLRRQMESRMRQEIESQMRSGDFDRSRLPEDFRPEGMFPPPEAADRAPANREGMSRPDGYPTMPPPGSYPRPPENWGGTSMPPENTPPPPPPPEEVPTVPPPSEKTSMVPASGGASLVANVLSVIYALLGR